jgi:hypothetical protein
MLHRLGYILHPLQRPEQVNRGRAAVCELVDTVLQAFFKLLRCALIYVEGLQANANSIGGSDANSRRTADL